MVVVMLFIVTILVFLLVALTSFYLILVSSQESLTFNDLERVYCLDRGYIALAPRESWNDLD
jgi:hypothetical protein